MSMLYMTTPNQPMNRPDYLKQEAIKRFDVKCQNGDFGGGIDPYEMSIFLLSELQLAIDQTTERVVNKVRNLIACPGCNGTGNADSIAGASECSSCGGDGHRLSGMEGTNIDELFSSLPKQSITGTSKQHE